MAVLAQRSWTTGAHSSSLLVPVRCQVCFIPLPRTRQDRDWSSGFRTMTALYRIDIQCRMVSSDDVGQDSTIWTVRGFPFIQPSSWPHNLPLAVPILALGPITCRVLQGTVYKPHMSSVSLLPAGNLEVSISHTWLSF